MENIIDKFIGITIITGATIGCIVFWVALIHFIFVAIIDIVKKMDKI